MAKIYLIVEINDEGTPRRASNDPPLTATPAQMETYGHLYTAYEAEKRAWWHWFNLREHFRKQRDQTKPVDLFDTHWSNVADKTTQLLRRAV